MQRPWGRAAVNVAGTAGKASVAGEERGRRGLRDGLSELGQSPMGRVGCLDFILRGMGSLWSIHLMLCSWLVSC